MIEIPLAAGPIAFIDDVDQELTSQYSWSLRRVVTKTRTYLYVLSNKRVGCPQIYLHRLIMGVTGRATHIDHINHDGLDNRRENLRVCTNSQNQGNRRLTITSQSGYKGVTWFPRTDQWQVHCTGHHVGLFNDSWEAAQAYNRAALAQWGEFALLNQQQGAQE